MRIHRGVQLFKARIKFGTSTGWAHRSSDGCRSRQPHRTGDDEHTATRAAKVCGSSAIAQDAADDELYREALSSSLKQVSDHDLERTILFFEPHASHAQSLR